MAQMPAPEAAPEALPDGHSAGTPIASDGGVYHEGAPDGYYGDGGCQEGCGDGYCNGGDCGGYCDDGQCYGGCGSTCCEYGPGYECGDGYYAGDCYGPSCECCPPVDCCPSYRVPRFAMWADWLYLHTTDADVAYAYQADSGAGAGSAPQGQVGSVGMDFDDGLRIGGAIGCGDCANVMFSWTRFENDSSSDLGLPPITGGFGDVLSLVTHPGVAVTNGNVGAVHNEYEIDYQIADIMYHHICWSGSCHYVGLIAGAQYGHLEQDFTQVSGIVGGTQASPTTSTQIDFDGGGLKAGLSGERQMGKVLSMYGHITGAAMSGRFRSHYSQYAVVIDQQQALAHWSDDRIVPQLEYELGLACNSGRHVRFSAGYMVSHWFNTVTTSDFIDAVQANNYTDVGDTLSFEGLVTRIEAHW
jgi:hypothetical protein